MDDDELIRYNYFKLITDKIIELLKKGFVPWRKPWSVRAGPPVNLYTGKQYHGVNIFLLSGLGYNSPYFVTENQARKLRGGVKEGEKGHLIVNCFMYRGRHEDCADSDAIPVFRAYTVFNIEQCYGLEARIPPGPGFIPEKEPEKIRENMPNPPKLFHEGDRAFYSPDRDIIKVPYPEVFSPPEEYYCTVFHELIHSTGHQSRLNRKSFNKYNPFGSYEYSKEELIAEMGAAFLSGMSGIERATIENSAAYISSWLQQLNNDERLIFYASSAAQRAVNYILSHEEMEKPAGISERNTIAGSAIPGSTAGINVI